MTIELSDGLVHRLAEYARAQLVSELRYLPDDLNNPVDVLERWLRTRPGGPERSLPTPTAEPGDLLVKLSRGEFWTFNGDGWLELAPVYRIAEPSFGPAPDHGDFGGVSGAARNVGDPASTPAAPPLIRAADELRTLAGAIRRTIEVAEQPDLGVDDRLRAFCEGLETARRVVLEVPE